MSGFVVRLVCVLSVPVAPSSQFVRDFVNVIRSDSNEGFTDVCEIHVSPKFLFDGVFDLGFGSSVSSRRKYWIISRSSLTPLRPKIYGRSSSLGPVEESGLSERFEMWFFVSDVGFLRG